MDVYAVTEFLRFEKFISKEALIVFYYLGALALPGFLILSARWAAHRFHHLGDAARTAGKDILWNTLDGNHKLKLTIAFVACLLLMELFWRMLFEFLIAYMQIHDALLHLS
jgi:uncharacterized membrane protein